MCKTRRQSSLEYQTALSALVSKTDWTKPESKLCPVFNNRLSNFRVSRPFYASSIISPAASRFSQTFQLSEKWFLFLSRPPFKHYYFISLSLSTTSGLFKNSQYLNLWLDCEAADSQTSGSADKPLPMEALHQHHPPGRSLGLGAPHSDSTWMPLIAGRPMSADGRVGNKFLHHVRMPTFGWQAFTFTFNQKFFPPFLKNASLLLWVPIKPLDTDL